MYREQEGVCQAKKVVHKGQRRDGKVPGSKMSRARGKAGANCCLPLNNKSYRLPQCLGFSTQSPFRSISIENRLEQTTEKEGNGGAFWPISV